MQHIGDQGDVQFGVRCERSGVFTGSGQSLPQAKSCAVHPVLLPEREVGLEPATRSDVLEGNKDLFTLGILNGHMGSRAGPGPGAHCTAAARSSGHSPDLEASEPGPILSEQHLAPHGHRASGAHGLSIREENGACVPHPETLIKLVWVQRGFKSFNAPT